MKTLCKILVLCLVFTLLLCGCNAKSKDKEPDYSSLILPPVDLSITDCITAEELTAIMGSPMQLLGVYEDNSQAVFTSEDGTHQVLVHMLNQTLAGFEAMKNESAYEMTWQEGLGEAAYWYGETSQLMFFSGGYAVDIGISGTDEDNQAHNTYTRQIAETILNKLPQTQE